MSKEYPRGTHPNSLKQLTKTWDSESAKQAQLLGVAKKKANKLAREQLQMTMSAWKSLQDELKDSDISSVDMLKVMMMQKLDEGDTDTAIDIMKTLAEFERPKLARIESKIEDVGATELSDEELNERIKALNIKD